MDTDDIKITDWYRILFGEAPPEIIIEEAILYCYNRVHRLHYFRIAPN